MGYRAGGRSGLKGLGRRELYLDERSYPGGVLEKVIVFFSFYYYFN